MKLTKRNKHSVIYTWLVSYIVTLMMPIAGFVVAYLTLNRTMVNQLSEYNNLLMDSLMTTVSDVLIDNTKVVNFIVDSPNVKTALELTQMQSGEDYYLLNKLRNEMKTYSNGLGIQSTFYIYFKEIDMIVSNNEVVSSREYYNLYYKKMKFSYEEWLSQIMDFTDPYSIIGEKTNMFFYKVHLPINSRYHKKASMVVETKLNTLLQHMEDRNNFEYDFAVFGNKKELILASKGVTDTKLKGLRNITEDGTYSIDGKKYVVKIEDNSVHGYTCICAANHDMIIEKIRFLSWICVGVTLIVALLGGYVISKSIKKNYLPLERLVKKVQNFFSEGSDEYDIIYRAVSQMQNDNVHLENILEKQRVQFRNNYLCRYMKYPLEDEGNVVREKYDIHFAGNNFIVMLFHFEDFEDFFENENEISDEDKFNNIAYIVKNVMEEVARTKGCCGFVVEIESALTLLLSFSDANAKNAENIAWQIAEFGQEFFSNTLRIYFKIAFSKLQTGMSGISIAYSQAVSAMEYKLILRDEWIFSASKLSKSPKKGEYIYDLETEQKLINFIKLGNKEKAFEIIDEVCKKPIENDVPNIERFRIQIYDVIGTLLKISPESGCDRVEISSEWSDLDELKNKIKENASAICEFYSSSNDVQIRTRVEKYVALHYMDVNLGVAQIAENLHIHRSYLSTTYKAQSGIGVLEFINRYRLEKAKQLLRDSQMSIEEISSAVGYSERRTLLRIFKKYEGITAVQYRTLYKDNENTINQEGDK